MLENFRKTQLIWDKASTKIKDYLRANSSDNHGRKLSVTVTDDGRVVDLTGVSLMLYWESQDKKVNGLDSFTAVHAQTGQFEIYYTPELLSNVGNLNAQLVLIDGSGRVASETFEIRIFKGVDDGAVVGQASFTALTDALLNAQKLEENYAPRLNAVEINKADKTEVNNLTAQLAQTMTQTEFDSWVATLLDGGPSIFMDSLAVLQSTYPNGASGVALVRETDPAKIYVWDGGTWKDFGDYQGIELKFNSVESLNLKRNSVGDREAKFPLVRTETTSNLFDNTTAIAGFYVGQSSGTIMPSSSNTASDWIEINPSEVYTMRHKNQSAFYDEQKEYISGFNADAETIHQPYTFTSPASARYIRITTHNSRTGTQQLNRGDTLLTYERGAPVVPGRHIKEASITPDKLDARTNELVYNLQKNRNLFDAENVTEGVYIGSGTGNEVTNISYSASEYIQIIPEKSYFIKFRDQAAFYDVDYKYLSGIDADLENLNQPYSFTTPKNAHFMRISVRKSLLNEQQLNTGSVLQDSTKIYQNRFNIAFLGDSITAAPDGWTKYIVDELLPKSATNLAVPSATFSDRTGDVEDPDYAYDGNPVNGGQGNNNTFGNQVQKLITGSYPTPDIILISFITNDPLGSPPIAFDEIQDLVSNQFDVDFNSIDRTTIAGAMRHGLERLQTAYENAKIILCTPIQSSDGHYFREYSRQRIRREMVIAVSDRMSLEFIDNFNCGIYGRNEPYEADGKYLSDGIHPNSKGKETQGKFAANKLINLLYI